MSLQNLVSQAVEELLIDQQVSGQSVEQFANGYELFDANQTVEAVVESGQSSHVVMAERVRGIIKGSSRYDVLKRLEPAIGYYREGIVVYLVLPRKR